MTRLFIYFLIICLPLVGCGAKDDAVKGAYDIKGIISEIDKESNQILVKDTASGLIWITLQQNESVENYHEGQEITIWIDGAIKESHPAQAKALHIEVLNDDVTLKKSSGLSTFIFEDEFPPPTPGYIKVGETRYDMAKGGFQWKNGNSSVQTDAASPLQIAEDYKPIEMEAHSTAILEIEQNPKLRAYIWNTKESIPDIEENQITMPSNKGRYIYEVTAKWSNGEVSYTFVVEIK